MQVARRQVDLAGAADVVLAGLADVLHGRADLVHADHLLLAGDGDLQGHLAGLLDAAAEGADRLAADLGALVTALHRLAALFGLQHRLGHGLLNVAEDAAHLGRGLLGLLGQRLHLLRHHREALAGLAGLHRLDRGVHPEQVGLLGQVVHRGDDFADGLTLLAQAHHALGHRLHLRADLAHALEGLVHRLASGLGHLASALGAFGDRLGLVAGEDGGLLHLFHRGGDLADGGGGLLGARGNLGGDREDLFAGGGQHRDAFVQFLHQFAQVAAHVDECQGQPAHLVLAGGIGNVPGDFAAADLLGPAGQARQWLGDMPA
ncbi:hypothetical protein D3C84_592550 [compost metagenome]